jgi:hypothetical protein
MGHGVDVSEVPSAAKPPVSIDAGLAVYFGTAPITSTDLTNVNKTNLCFSLEDFVAALGPLSDDFASWTLHEAAKAHFKVYEVAPVVFVNILDPANSAHVATVTGQSHQLVNGKVQIQVYGGPDAPLLGVIESTVVVKKGVTLKTLNVDYTLAFDDDGFLVVSVKSGGSLGNSDILLIDFHYIDPSLVTANDVIGGYSGGKYKGLEVVHQVYPKLRKVTGFILAPKWSEVPAVAARMAVLARAVSGTFRAQAVCDLSTSASDIPTYADAPAWKTDNGFTSVDMVACWPKVKNGSDVYHASTVFACVAGVTDAAHDGVPYASPSNKAVIGTSVVLDDGTEVLLTQPQANTLNDQGIVTVLNGFFGWRLWGNRTAAYPGTTDVKDAFIPVRRMFNWIGNTVILTTQENVDDPITRRLVDLVVGTVTSYFNGLVAAGALIAGKIEFRASENPTTNLADGKIKFHLTLTPPSPAQEVQFVLEYDAAALAALFTT